MEFKFNSLKKDFGTSSALKGCINDVKNVAVSVYKLFFFQLYSDH